MFQNDGTRNGNAFNTTGSFNANINSSVSSNPNRRSVSEWHDEIVSSSSFLSKTSSKFEVD